MDTQTNIYRCLPKIAELGKIGQVYVHRLITVSDVYPRQNQIHIFYTMFLCLAYIRLLLPSTSPDLL